MDSIEARIVDFEKRLRALEERSPRPEGPEYEEKTPEVPPVSMAGLPETPLCERYGYQLDPITGHSCDLPGFTPPGRWLPMYNDGIPLTSFCNLARSMQPVERRELPSLYEYRCSFCHWPYYPSKLEEDLVLGLSRHYDEKPANLPGCDLIGCTACVMLLS